MDQVHAKGSIQTLVRSLSRFSEKVLLILSNKRDVSASGEKIGPCLIFGRLWKELGIKKVTKDILADRKFEFDVERAIFSLYFIGSLPLDLTGPVINGAGSM